MTCYPLWATLDFRIQFLELFAIVSIIATIVDPIQFIACPMELTTPAGDSAVAGCAL